MAKFGEMTSCSLTT